MKKLLLCAVALATLMSANAQNLITDGSFESTTVGNFTLTSSVASSSPRNVWAAFNISAPNGDPVIGVVSGITGATGSNCASFIQNDPPAKSGRLYQRLSSSAIKSGSIYKLTARVKSTGNVGVQLFIRNRGANKYAVRADWKSGDTYAGKLNVNGVTSTWTTVSATFVFSSYCEGDWSTAATYNTAFTDAELQDLYVGVCGGKYGVNDPNITVYFDDVQLVEVNSTK